MCSPITVETIRPWDAGYSRLPWWEAGELRVREASELGMLFK